MKRFTIKLILFLIIGIIGFNCSKKNPASNEPTDIWDDFNYPNITYTNEDSLGKGEYFTAIFGSPGETLKELVLGVCKQLYKDPAEPPQVVQISLIIKDFDGVAYASGSSTNKTITFSSNYLKQKMDQGKSASEITFELKGVFTHELTHVYQFSCEYQNDGWSLIEGVADAVRYLAGYDLLSRRHTGGTWIDGYTSTGFFIVWLQENKDNEFLYKLNMYALFHYQFYWEAAMNEILEASVKPLWEEYQTAIGSNVAKL